MVYAAGRRKTVGPRATPTTLAHFHISDDLSNGLHLEVSEAVELGAGDTKLAPSRTQTVFSASERHLAHIDGQLGNPHADPSCH
jgi:hypothetical protein